jgi:fumarate hydratase subunit alpha
MRSVSIREIQNTVEELCIKANSHLRHDILIALQAALTAEENRKAKKALGALLANAHIARADNLALCQDTGIVLVYLDIGTDVHLAGGDLQTAVDRGVSNAYHAGRFRNSVVGDPLRRTNTGDNTPAILYVKFRAGRRIKITVSPKGFGSENKSQAKMFNPTDSIDEIKRFIVDAVHDAGPDACPPFIIGIGMGGTYDTVAYLAKEAQLQPLGKKNPVAHLAQLENELLTEINKLGIGPMGLGGKTTALGVAINAHPTHIAGLPT